MKKTIAGIAALTIALSAFTGCTDKKNDKSTASKGAVTTAQENKEGKTSAESSCEDVIREFIQAYNDNDREKTFTMMYPDGSIDLLNVWLKTSEDDDYTIEDYINEAQYMIYDDNEPEKINFKRIISTEPLIPDEEYDIKREYGTIQCMVDYMNEHGGPDKVEPEKLEEFVTEQSEEDVFEKTEITEGYYVLMELENENGDTDKGKAIVYRLNGGGWKISANDLIGTRSRGRDKRLDTSAESLYRAVNTALIELDEEGYIKNDSDEFIVSSDSSKDFNVPADFDADLFRSRIKNYCDYEGDWFVKMQGAYALETAVFDSEKPHNVGTYPPSDSPDFAYEGMSYDEIYDKVCEDIG